LKNKQLSNTNKSSKSKLETISKSSETSSSCIKSLKYDYSNECIQYKDSIIKLRKNNSNKFCYGVIKYNYRIAPINNIQKLNIDSNNSDSKFEN